MGLANVHAQVIVQPRAADPPRDFCVNNVWHQIDDLGGADLANYSGYAASILTAFRNGTGGAFAFSTYANRGITVKVYNYADAKPRPVRATTVYVPTTYESTALSSREVALCLSYYGTRNLPRQRGRIYIGPHIAVSVVEKPTSALMDSLLDLGHALSLIGKPAGGHVIHSKTANNFVPVTNYWVNDQWDHISAREQKETTRRTAFP